MAIDTISIESKTCSSNPSCIPSDCSWGSWTDETSCSLGEKIRRRKMIQQVECGGEPCSGNAIEETECCNSPINCRISPWSLWGNCSGNDNLQTRNRSIIIAARCNGSECEGPFEQVRNCTEDNSFFDCDFEYSICGMDGYYYSDWHRGMSTSTSLTGPSQGEGNSRYFLYLESNSACDGCLNR